MISTQISFGEQIIVTLNSYMVLVYPTDDIRLLLMADIVGVV